MASPLRPAATGHWACQLFKVTISLKGALMGSSEILYWDHGCFLHQPVVRVPSVEILVRMVKEEEMESL